MCSYTRLLKFLSTSMSKIQVKGDSISKKGLNLAYWANGFQEGHKRNLGSFLHSHR